jgi:hypothetical protein
MTKRLWFPKYWATEQPIVKEMAVTRFEHVQDKAGTQGAKIGNVGAGVHLKVDMNEQDMGDVRIIEVIDCLTPPVPTSWEQKQIDRPEQEREWWVDKTALMDVGGSDPGKVRLLVERDELGHWKVTEL